MMGRVMETLPVVSEEVGAAIVLRERQTATVTEIREFAALRLADFKVPREIVFLVDVSGSMNGFPLATSKTLITEMLNGLREKDYFNILRTKLKWGER